QLPSKPTSTTPVSPLSLHDALPISPEGVAAHRDGLAPMFLDADGNLLLSIHSLVVEADGKCMLVDTCIGSRPVPGYEMLSNRERDRKSTRLNSSHRTTSYAVFCFKK